MKYATSLSIALLACHFSAFGQKPVQKSQAAQPRNSCCGQANVRPAYRRQQGRIRRWNYSVHRGASRSLRDAVARERMMESGSSPPQLPTTMGTTARPKTIPGRSYNCRRTAKCYESLPNKQMAPVPHGPSAVPTWKYNSGNCPANGKMGEPAKIHRDVGWTRHTAVLAGSPTFGVFAFSGRPDHVPGNNNWWWREHCEEGVTSITKEQPLPAEDYHAAPVTSEDLQPRSRRSVALD